MGESWAGLVRRPACGPRAVGLGGENLAFDKETAEATQPLDPTRAALSRSTMLTALSPSKGKVEGRNALSGRGLTAAAKRLAKMAKFTRQWRVRMTKGGSGMPLTRAGTVVAGIRRVPGIRVPPVGNQLLACATAASIARRSLALSSAS